jgi:hypothetical protein
MKGSARVPLRLVLQHEQLKLVRILLPLPEEAQGQSTAIRGRAASCSMNLDVS